MSMCITPTHASTDQADSAAEARKFALQECVAYGTFKIHSRFPFAIAG
jgi:hypothetical protein